MRFHWQNLNDKHPVSGRRKKQLHGRAWWRKWRLEWVLPSWRSWGVSLSVNGGDSSDEVMVHLGCGLFSFYLSRSGLPINWFGEWKQSYRPGWDNWFCREEREFHLTAHNGHIWLTVWGRAIEHRSADPWWIRGVSFSPVDFLLGSRKHEHRLLGPQREVLIPMPEGCYLALMRPEERRWWRPRWPWWPCRILNEYIDIQIEGGVPFMGKGENSWDCGEDGLWGTSSRGFSYEKAVGKVVESVLENRRKYGTPERLKDQVRMAPPRPKKETV